MSRIYLSDNTGAPKNQEIYNIFWEKSGSYCRGTTTAARWKVTNGSSIGAFGVHAVQSELKNQVTLHDWARTYQYTQNLRQRDLALNEHYPRIFRPGTPPAAFQDQRRQASVAIGILCDRLSELFRFIEPVQVNVKAYGHETRNVLLLACMEVEAQLSAILSANGYHGSRWTTQDYVKLLSPLHLAEYTVQLAFYPGIRSITPFASWASVHPTQSLPWYYGYNQTKHDRERCFREATLEWAIQAVAAAVTLFHAQFGDLDPSTLKFGLFVLEKIPTFSIDEYPLWERVHPDFHWSQVAWSRVNFQL